MATTAKLKIQLSDSGKDATVVAFDGVSGLMSQKLSIETNLIQAQIFSSESSSPIWQGTMEVDGTNFTLCLNHPTAGTPIIRWSEVPKLLSVFDGGYRALSQHESLSLLDDIVAYHDVASGKLHFGENWIDCGFTDQDSLKDLSELCLVWADPSTKPSIDQVVGVELTLFENTYILLGHFLDADDKSIVISLTNHIYLHHRREGRRIRSSGDHRISTHRVIEVSDHGLKLEWTTDNFPPVGEALFLDLNGKLANFQCIYVNNENNARLVGLEILSESSEIQTAWQEFLLPFQYPRLSKRSATDHERTWELLQESGYLEGNLGGLIKHSKSSVFEEWEYLDRAGVGIGTSVIGVDEERAVATIGIARACGNTWIAQAAAAIDEPRYLEFTRSMYGWRTRAILQQPGSEYHLAFFAADKPFLDRFFRKFFLNLSDHDKKYVTWDEWTPYSVNIEKLNTDSKIDVSPPANLPGSLRSKLRSDKYTGLIVQSIGDTVLVNGRPHQHLAQFLATAWINTEEVNLPEIEENFAAKKHGFAILMVQDHTIDSVFSSLAQTGKLTKFEKEVVWTCHRTLLPRFLGNSLRSLEQMLRKYGPRRVA